MATRVISTSIKLDGEAEFKKQMSSVNSELKTLKSEMAYTEAAFKGQGNTMEALTEKDRLLRKEIEQQTAKIEASEKMVKEAEKAQKKFADAIENARQKASDAGVSFDRLRGNTEDLTDEEKKLASELLDAEASYDKITRKVNDYKQTLNRAKTDLIKMNDELDDNSRYLDEARRSTNKTADSIDEFGREIKDTRGDLENFNDEAKNAPSNLDKFADGIGNFAGSLYELKGLLAGGAVAVGVKELTGAIMDVEESTREYRKIMGTLETSSAAAGYTAEQTKESYTALYGVLGDTQTAATTVANLQAIGLEQTKLKELITQVTGAWAKYGDSIPIDGLAESINETIKAQQVTGTFADVLNWGTQEGETFGIVMRENTEVNKEWNQQVEACTSAEDYFNLALQQCSSDAERANLVMQAMARQGLTETGNAWKENNKDIVEMNESQAELEAAMGRMGELLSPLAAKLINFGSDALTYVIEKVQSAVSWFTNLNQKLNESSNQRLQAGVEAYNSRTQVSGSHASGLNRVPYDGYIAELHYDEAILTAQEARVWRSVRAANQMQASPAAPEVPKSDSDPNEGQTLTIINQITLDDRVVGESVSRYQVRNGKAVGV